jgi:hypothetical protein
LLLLLLCVSPWSVAESPRGGSSDQSRAVATPASERDDLVLGIWAKIREGKPQEAIAHSRRLLQVDANDALACATLIEARATGDGDDSPLDLGRRGLRNVGQMQRPQSMSEDEFAAMQQRVRLTLNTAVGQAYLDRGDAVTARRYLKEAVALAPWSGQHTYLASRAFLEGRNPDKGAAFWLLARTVVITHGTKSGPEIAQYAWDRFLKAGGNRDLWVQYLERASAAAPRLRDEVQVASAPGSPASGSATNQRTIATAGTSQPGASTGTIASSAPSATSTTQQAASTSPQQQPIASAQASSTQATSETAARTQPSGTQPTSPAPSRRAESGSANVQSDEGIAGDLAQIERSQPSANGKVASNGSAVPSGTAPSIPSGRSDSPRSSPQEPPEFPTVAENIPPKFPSPTMRRPALSASAPLSLGVLIEARVASKENRVRVVYALSDMLRHLRENDEAFVVSYGRNVGLEQDLTWNYDLLEKAMDSIDPQQGSALLDAVSFSAGHLKRIAKNPNRVLLVISDGSNDFAQGTPLDQATEIMSSGARIYCIGLGVPGAAERNRLLELASRTGGRATFIDDPNGFRSAAHDIASNLGIDFPE